MHHLINRTIQTRLSGILVGGFLLVALGPASLACPDLKVAYISVRTEPVIAGESERIEFGISNLGDFYEGEISGRILIDGDVVEEFFDPRFFGGGTYWFTTVFDECPTQHELCVEVDPIPNECRLDNNIKCIPIDVECPPGDCLSMTVQNLVAGGTALWEISDGKSGAAVAVVWGTGGDQQTFSDCQGYCATFGFGGIRKSRVIGITQFDQNGFAAVERRVPPNAAGVRVLMQAMQRDTCPGECMSNLIEAVVQ